MKNIVKIERNANVYFRLGEKKRSEGQMDEAVYYFFRCAQTDDCIDALVELGKTYAQMDCHTEGLKYLFRALDKAPLNTQIRQTIGDIFSDLDDEETAFFYIAPAMTIKRFNRIIEQESIFENVPPVRVLEKNDEMTLNIAVKLFESGDNKYAVQILDAIKPSSEQFIIAANMLTLYEIEQGNYEKAKKHLDQAIEKKDTVLGRCSQLLLYNKITGEDVKGSVFNDLRQMKKQDIIKKIQDFKMSHSERKSVTLSLIRANEPEYAIEHLKKLLHGGNYDKEAMTCYALCLYACGNTIKARNAIFKAHYAYPNDLEIKYFLDQITLGNTNLGLGPNLKEETQKEWIASLTHFIDEMAAKTDDVTLQEQPKSEEIFQKLEWLYQTDYAYLCSRAALVLTCFKPYLPLFKRLLLLDTLSMRSKKVILFSVLLHGVNSSFIQPECKYPSSNELKTQKDNEEYDFYGFFEEELLSAINADEVEHKPFLKRPKLSEEFDSGTYTEKGRIGIVLDGLYVRLRVVYPNDTDETFLTGYCLAYSSFAVCDSCFEDRLLGAALRALKKYNAPGFDKSLIAGEDVLAAALFYAARHTDIHTTRQCSQLFGVSEELVSECLSSLSLRRTKRKKIAH